MSNALALACPRCDGPGVVPRPTSDPAVLLRRLPSPLWDTDAPADRGRPAAIFDEVYADISRFDDSGESADATVQWNIARWITEERDRWVQGWRQAEALQLAVGRVRVEGGGVVTETPRAGGSDLDRLGAQFGVGRPFGFTDCCYWRLVQLLLFTPGPTATQLMQIALLYTGTLVECVEQPCKIILVWPPVAATPDVGASYYDANSYFGNAYYDAVPADVATTYDGYWTQGTSGDADSWWTANSVFQPVGLTLEEALELARPAGVRVELVRPPRLGQLGCYSATSITAAVGRGMWTGEG